ncbi:hypothetical protein SNEBB_001537 [Seison nebaliae]|nr:hypothetical protein SNEBB_001537 [Seison nebaliae]
MLSIIRIYFCVFVFQQEIVQLVSGRGHLCQPEARNSCWINGRDCGGFDVQWNKNDGKCCVCGDPYDPSVKEHEGGDKLYNKENIGGTYKIGAWIPVKVTVSEFFPIFVPSILSVCYQQ